MDSGFEPVIGLEIHIQLPTRRKLLAPESFQFGDAPNRWLSAVTAAHPGALPFPNREALISGARLGLAVGSEIARISRFDRKHYFYPDLPKGYQTTQDQTPVCRGGWIDFLLPDGTADRVALDRIHLEEDAGKLLHDQDALLSMVDLNRAGTPLLELVTRPELFSAQAAAACFAAVRSLVRFLDICDGNLEEGSMRCDANISLRPTGSDRLGQRVEIKNLNSFAFLTQAVNYEIGRQQSLLSQGRPVTRETRGWDALLHATYPLREKEDAEDYRYFPDPDQLPLCLSEEDVAFLRQNQPELPMALYRKWTSAYHLSPAEAMALLEAPERAQYFEALACLTPGREAANWLLGPVQAWLHRQPGSGWALSLKPETLSALIIAVGQGRISHHAAKDAVLPVLLTDPSAALEPLLQSLIGEAADASGRLDEAMRELMATHPDEVRRYRQGKKNLTGFFVGQMMRAFGGKADPKEVNEAVQRGLDSP